MSDTPRPYCETTDLYLQLLGDARRIEDPKMVRMVLRKMRRRDGYRPPAASGRDVIPFPGLPRLQNEGGPSEPLWHDTFFWQNLVQFLILLAAAAAWLTLPFILVVPLALG